MEAPVRFRERAGIERLELESRNVQAEMCELEWAKANGQDAIGKLKWAR